MMTPPSKATRAVPVDLHHDGKLADDDLALVREAIGTVATRHHSHTHAVRVRICAANCSGGPALIQVNLRVNGAPARIQIPGRTTSAAIAAAASRLDRQIRRLTTTWEPWSWPDPARRPLGVPGQGAIARLKTPRLHTGMPCQAAAVLNAMDYDVHLFTDADTGEEAIIYRAGPTGLRLARQHTMYPPTMPITLPMTINPRKVPTLTPAQAARRLADCWLPFVFFTDAGTERGHLLYRRYDGDLGLIGPHPTNP